jgi:hypothetical protein
MDLPVGPSASYSGLVERRTVMKQRLHYAKAGTYAAMEGLDAYVEAAAWSAR